MKKKKASTERQATQAGGTDMPPLSKTDFTETPEAYEARIKQEKIKALQEEVAKLAGGKPAGGVVFRFKTAKGETGSNLGYYLDCKKHEIETGTPCNLLEPLGPPVEATIKASRGMQPLGSQSPVKTSFCKNC